MNILEIKNLKKAYPSFVLNDVSFHVPQGSIMGLIGRNGAGKSTTIKSVLGLVHADSGMRVKYLIALALSHNAKLLILDEPTSGLDPVSRDELVGLFRAIVKDGSRSILFSTHITSDLEKCADFITFIKDGSIVYSGTKDSFTKAFAAHGNTLEDIIVSVERSPLDEGTII